MSPHGLDNRRPGRRLIKAALQLTNRQPVSSRTIALFGRDLQSGLLGWATARYLGRGVASAGGPVLTRFLRPLRYAARVESRAPR